LDRIEQLKIEINALKEAGLPTTAKEAELTKLQGGGASQAQAPAAVAAGEAIPFDIEVDIESFDSGGQQFIAPTKPDIYDGFFEAFVHPTTKPGQIWAIFQTRDNRVVKQLGRQARSPIIITPGGDGAFKLKDILDGLKVSYTRDGKHVKGSIPKGLPCKMEYREGVIDGKTRILLQEVYAGEIQQAV